MLFCLTTLKFPPQTEIWNILNILTFLFEVYRSKSLEELSSSFSNAFLVSILSNETNGFINGSRQSQICDIWCRLEFRIVDEVEDERLLGRNVFKLFIWAELFDELDSSDEESSDEESSETFTTVSHSDITSRCGTSDRSSMFHVVSRFLVVKLSKSAIVESLSKWRSNFASSSFVVEVSLSSLFKRFAPGMNETKQVLD